MKKIDFSKENLTEEELRALPKLSSETDSDFELRKLFLMNSKIVGPCPRCGKSWRILKWERRPAKKLIARKCPHCNPLGITIRKGRRKP